MKMTDHRTHADLLSQVAGTEHERDEVRRILGEVANRAIDARLIDYSAHTRPKCCTANCSQGRACPARQACELPEPDTSRLFARYALLLSVAIVAGIAWSVFG
jgi:hypothetical protein